MYILFRRLLGSGEQLNFPIEPLNSMMPIVAIDLSPFLPIIETSPAIQDLQNVASRTILLQCPGLSPNGFTGDRAQLELFSIHATLGRWYIGETTQGSLKQLVAEVSFFDVDWNFLPVEIVEYHVAATGMIIHSRYSVLCNALACSCFLHLLTSETLNFEPMTRS